MMPDPVTGLLQVLIVIGIPAAVLMWAARECGQTRWFGVFGLLSYLGLLVGMLMIDRRKPSAERR